MNSASPDRDGREGLYNIPLATLRGRRAGPRDYILKTIEEGFPLTVQTDALVTRVLLDDRRSGGAGGLRARGVEYLPGPHLFGADPLAQAGGRLPAPVQVLARKEVVVAAGAFNTPHLLMLSGLGPADSLHAHGVTPVLDLPGVGQNLQDRYEIPLVSELPSDFDVVAHCSFSSAVDDECLRAWRQGRGPYATSGAVIALVKRSDPALPRPDLFLLGIPAHFRGYFPGYSKLLTADRRHFSWIVLEAHTHNRKGEVKLASADARVPPEIHFHSFDEGSHGHGEDRQDVTALVRGLELARKIDATANWMKVLPGRVQGREILPGPEVATPEQLAAFAEREAWGHHASCSCPIGRAGDPLAVLDGDFRVRGVAGLRVVDASVFPKIPGFFIALPIYLAAEKATEAILKDA